MRLVFILMLGVAGLVASCRTSPRPLDSIAEDLRRVVPAGWHVTRSNEVVHIESPGAVWLLGPSGPGMMPGESEAQYAQQHGLKTKYVVTLRFVPKLSRAQLERLREQRRPWEQALEVGAHDKSKAAAAAKASDQHPLPRFATADYSVFVEWPYEAYGVYPPEAAAEVEQLVAGLTRLFPH
ncbi:MAG TPA: hypothetical protein VNT26_06805 [Candidatus Sulfotelmatobacter sp.]|nr:hypothetical protein [Candidatus Sulfotelmatobacter sp.]HWI57250.1 hypothetical protein [Bacillota bacterium]